MTLTAARRSELLQTVSTLVAGSAKAADAPIRRLFLNTAWHPDYTAEELKFIHFRLKAAFEAGQ